LSTDAIEPKAKKRARKTAEEKEAERIIAEAIGKVEIVDVSDIRPSTYNPRKVFPERLELVRLSLAKFGFLLPIYAGQDGEILSGHQRHYVATEMLGATKVPVVKTRKLTGAQARSLNLLFNRATNDLSLLAMSEPLADALMKSDVPAKLAHLPDIDVNDHEAWMPVLKAVDVPTIEVLDANPIWSDEHGIKMACSVVRLGQTDIMPIVITPSKKIVNGAARCAAAGKLGRETIKAVVIPEELAEAASGLLNLLSMKYEVEGKLADDLRANAFKAAPSVRYTMSVNATFELVYAKGKTKSYRFDHTKPEHAKAWIRHYGPCTLDFGAGNYWDAKHAQDMGATATAFEPYYAWDLEKAREMADDWFFSRLNDGRRFNSIFLSNVMNTVPFDEDRLKVVRIVAALSDPSTVLYASGRARRDVSGEVKQRLDRTNGGTAACAIHLDESPGTRISSVEQKPIIQKFHTEQEFAALWRTGYQRVEHEQDGSHVLVRAWNPRPISDELLREAILFEFDLPWPNGQRFERGQVALEAIAKFTNRPGLLG
jgi:ParB-like chromosome segregation protein Spo0J